MAKRLQTIALFVFSVATTPMTESLAASLSPNQAAASLAVQLRSVNAVEFFFLSRTESWTYTLDEIAAKSEIRVYRACGSNCHNFMKPVLDHLRAARPVRCTSGQEDGLIRAQPGIELVYSLSGRQIRVEGNCYFNERGIEEVVSGKSMLFASGPRPTGQTGSANNSFVPTRVSDAAFPLRSARAAQFNR